MIIVTGGSGKVGRAAVKHLMESGYAVTSIDMAGASITVSLLDEDAQRLWDAPVRTAALRWGE